MDHKNYEGKAKSWRNVVKVALAFVLVYFTMAAILVAILMAVL